MHFQLPGNPNMVRVPATALVAVNSGAQVAVLSNDNTVTLKPVQLGRGFGDSVEVVAGLTPADRVIDRPTRDVARRRYRPTCRRDTLVEAERGRGPSPMTVFGWVRPASGRYRSPNLLRR